LTLLACAIGCREPFAALGGRAAPARARARAEQLFAALGARVTQPARDTKYDSARVKIVNAAFLPSRVWDDTSVWSGSTSARRTLLVGGRFVDGRYRFETARSVAAPAAPAESRHTIELTRLADGQYAWDTDVAYGIGSVTAPDVGAYIGALIAAAEGRNEHELRAGFRSTAPRTSATLSQLFRVDSVRTTHFADGSTLATYAIAMTPEGVEGRFPNFAQYVRRYAQTARMRWTLTDHTSASYFECVAASGRLLVRVRTLGGKPVSLVGPARPMPDSLTLNGEIFTMKVGRFTVGVREYHAEFTVIRGDHERAWNIVSRREPHWVLPLITEHLIRAPLRRPFQGNGAMFRLGVSDDSTGGQTLLQRSLHLEVQESLILRFIGRLGAIAVSEYAGQAEREQNAWLAEVFSALVADVKNTGD
jgi:hypothetical protein